ncbi:kinase-like domain-containing protein [Hyaloraphidium curvatum]|nr:kinase-like domain-containing protein [Hyaloraphidium curvatum]
MIRQSDSGGPRTEPARRRPKHAAGAAMASPSAAPPPGSPARFDAEAGRVVRTSPSTVSLQSVPVAERPPPQQTIGADELAAHLRGAAAPKIEEEPGGCFGCCRPSPAPKTPAAGTGRRRPSTDSKSTQSSGSSIAAFRPSMRAALAKTASFVGFSQLAGASAPQDLLLPLGPPSLAGETYLSTPRQIGWGAEGTVRIVKRRRDGAFLAAKVFRPSPDGIHLVRASFERTIGFAVGGHPNLVQILDLTRANDLAFTVMEYVPGGNLRMAMAKPGYIRSQAVADGIFVQLCRALLWMHAMGVAHRDIKLENVMWHPRRPLAKLADFGNADVFWNAKGFADGTFGGADNLGAAAFKKRAEERHLSEAILKGTGMTGTMSAGQMVQAAGGDLAYLGGRVVADAKPATGNGKAAGKPPPGKLFSAGDDDSDPETEDGSHSPPRASVGSLASSRSSARGIPRPQLDDPTSPSAFFQSPAGSSEEAEGRIDEAAFKGHLPLSPTEFRRPSRYRDPARNYEGPVPPAFSPSDDPTAPSCPIRLTFGTVGTAAYIAPEQYLSPRRPDPSDATGWYDPRPVDAWMCGVLYLYLSSRRIPWASATETEAAYRRWREGKGSKVMEDWEAMRVPYGGKEAERYFRSAGARGVIMEDRARLVRRMMEVDPRRRAGVAEIVADPAFGKMAEEFERRTRGLAQGGFYLDPDDAPKGGESFAAD